jgi:hypothetical protein
MDRTNGGGVLLAMTFSVSSAPVPVPEILHYRFDEAGTIVTNHASAPPAGTETATINGSVTQGNVFLPMTGGLIGTGTSSTNDFVDTHWPTNLSGSWTISFLSTGIAQSTSTYYILGDVNANQFRCFSGGVAGLGNWILRGNNMTDVYANTAASTGTHMTTFVYDATANTVTSYLDGAAPNIVGQGGPLVFASPGPFKVGAYSSNANLNGTLGDFRLYSHALTPEEVLNLYTFVTTDTPLSVVATATDATCNGGADGSATAVPTGGIGPFTYSWAPSGGTADMETGLAAGTYTVTVTDDFGLAATADATVAEPTAIVFGTTALPDATQFTAYSTSIAASGGTGSITYAQTGGTLPAGVTMATDGTLAGTPTDGGSFTFTVTATDGNSCAAPMDFTLFVDDTIFENGFDAP